MTQGPVYGERRPGLWLLAAALAVSLHAGGIALALRTVEATPLEEDDGGVLMVELAPMATTAAVPEQPMPPGPLSADAADSPASAAQQAEVNPPVEPDLPPLPVVAAPPPELTVPMETAKPIPEPERPAEMQQAAAASAASVASVAAAPPPIEAPAADKSAAPDPGLSRRDRQARERWESALSGHLARFGRFPDGVRGLKVETIVTVRFRLDRNGRVVATEVAESSGSEPLDSEAQAMIRRASPLPIPPSQVAGDRVELMVPVKFKVRR